MKKLITLLSVTLAVSTLLCGCGTTPKKIAYKTLSAVGEAGDGAANAVVEAYAKGLISEDAWTTAQEKYANFQKGYNNACRESAYSLNASPSQLMLVVLNNWLEFVTSLGVKP